MSNELYSWYFSDTKNRGSKWYIITASIVLGLTIWGIFTGQYGLSLIILLLTGITLFIENNSSDRINVIVNEFGIKIGEYFYDFSVIEKYSFIYSGENPIFLRLYLKKSGIKTIDLKVDSKICLEVKEILRNYIEESKSSELTSIEKIIKLLNL
ncbi:hypothetical protein HUU51_00455 [Candidatus Gracilibacteria bacterium]|nr:hypothetical protein [Candidatus Gracilibacteria bacterium]